MSGPFEHEIVAAGLERAASLFPEDVAVAFRSATVSRSLLPPTPPPEVEPWRAPPQIGA